MGAHVAEQLKKTEKGKKKKKKTKKKERKKGHTHTHTIVSPFGMHLSRYNCIQRVFS